MFSNIWCGSELLDKDLIDLVIQFKYIDKTSDSEVGGGDCWDARPPSLKMALILKKKKFYIICLRKNMNILSYTFLFTLNLKCDKKGYCKEYPD